MNTLQEVYDFIEDQIPFSKERDICSKIIKGHQLSSDTEFLNIDINILFARLENGSSNFTYEEWGQKEYDYLKQRAATVKNEKLVIRYNQILFNGDRKYKRQENAIKAIDAYYDILSNGLFDIWSEEGLESLCFSRVISNMLGLSTMVKNYKETEIKSLITNIFNTHLYNNNSFKYVLVTILIAFPKIYKGIDLNGFYKIIEDNVKENWANRDFFSTRYVIETGIQLSERLNQDVKIWYEMLGQNYEQFAEYRKDDPTGLVPIKMITEAILAYNKSGNTEKVDALCAKYPSLGENVRLTTVKRQLPERMVTWLKEKLEQDVANVLSADHDTIYEYFKFHLVLPDKKYLTEVKNPIHDPLGLYTIIGFDVNKNIKSNPETEEEQEKERMQSAYNVHNEFVVWPLVNEIFIRGIQLNILSFENLEAVLRNSWLGADLVEKDLAGVDYQYNWMDSILPGLRIVIYELEKGIKTPDYEPDILAGVDSLVIKFEGILRDIAWALKLNTKKVDSRSNSIREIYIEDLLRLSKFEEIFDEDDLLFFKFVYTKFGLNLRNNISHGFYRKHQYNIHQAYLIILSLLRLSKYNLVPTD